MNRRPAMFTLISVLLTTTLLSSIAYILTNDFDFNNITDVYLAGLLLTSGILLSIAALGTWRPRPWGYLALVATIGVVAALDIGTLLTSGTFTIFYLPDFVLIGSGILILSDRKARDLFFDASKRWWETAKRVTLGQASTARADILLEDIQIMNVSETGCLIRSANQHKIGEFIELKVAPGLWINSTVVRKDANQFGMKFEFRNWQERKELKEFVVTSDRNNATLSIEAIDQDSVSKVA